MADYIQKRNIFTDSLFPEPTTSTKHGQGLINKLINSSPVELHPFNYNFLGPGTHLERRLEKDIKPINKLDELAMVHDKAYAASNDLSRRHQADYELQEGSWNRFLDSEAPVGERAMAYLTTNAMKAKRYLGAGLKKKNQKINYMKYPVILNDEEQRKIFHAKKSFALKLTYDRFQRTKESVMNETFLPVTSYQLRRIKSAVHNKKNIEIKLSMKQIDFIRKNNKIGGFLPAIISALPAIAAVGSIISSAVNAYENKKTNDRLVAEKIRHNKRLEEESIKGGVKGNGLYDQLMKKSIKKKSLL